MYFFGLFNEDGLWGYLMDYLIYGTLYPMIGFDTDFKAIDFATP